MPKITRDRNGHVHVFLGRQTKDDYNSPVGKKAEMLSAAGSQYNKMGKVIKEHPSREDLIWVKFDDGKAGWYSRHDFRFS